MYVADITMQMKGPNLDTIVTIRADTDENGADSNDPVVAGVVPHVELCPTSGDCFFTTTTVATDSGGKVKYKLLKPPADTYTMTVSNVVDDSGTYDYDLGHSLDLYTYTNSYDIP